MTTEKTTKAVSLTEDEIKTLINHHGYNIEYDNFDERLDRMNYLNKRLKAFKEPETSNLVEQAQAPQQGWPE